MYLENNTIELTWRCAGKLCAEKTGDADTRFIRMVGGAVAATTPDSWYATLARRREWSELVLGNPVASELPSAVLLRRW